MDAQGQNRSPGRLGEVIGELEAAGFRGQMAARPGGRVMCFVCRRENDSSQFEVGALERTEGASDPDDMLAVAALTCPHCGAKGTLVLTYGPEADEDDADVLVRLHVDGEA